MNEKQEKRASKFLSLVLRHRPEVIGLNLDDNGWADVKSLLSKMNSKDFSISLEDLQFVVENNNKKRFIFSPDLTKIRANQGHSINVDLDLKPLIPPEILFHGTAIKNLSSIKKQGLIKGERHHVHLSLDIDTARNVGQRFGKPIVLSVYSGQMNSQGIEFYKSENDVWLTHYVDPKFIEFVM